MDMEEEKPKEKHVTVSVKWIKDLLLQPTDKAYETMPLPEIRTVVPRQSAWEDDEPFQGFSDFRKYKKANETRTITRYEPEKQIKIQDSPTADSIAAITIPDVKGFMFDRLEPITIEHPETLVKMVKDYPEVGYLHLSRDQMNIASNYNPYHYVVCNYDDIDKNNYATISPNGMIEFYKGHPDFLSLNRLLTEYKLYKTLCEIPSFQRFRMWKAFMIWFKKIRRMKFVEAREKLKLILVFKSELPAQALVAETEDLPLI